MKKSDAKLVVTLWGSSGLQFSDFLKDSSVSVDQFINDNNLVWIKEVFLSFFHHLYE